MILLIDNYDSFTWNLAHLLGADGREVRVLRNDAIDAAGVAALAPAGIVISPGPGRPEDAGATMEIIRVLGGVVPILGVCLGHQAIGCVYGANVVRQRECAHGVASSVRHDGTGLFAGIANPFPAGRYHSLAIDPPSLPPGLRVTATTDDGTIMGVRHVSKRVEGVQFHPESVLTPDGAALVANWKASL